MIKLMKKLLYLIPVLLIVLCATPFALYKDTVKPQGTLYTFSPSYWKVSIHINSSNDSLTPVNSANSAPTAFTEKASFKGFPFGAYFSSSNFTGWSWLWSLIDLIIIAATLVFAIRINRKSS